MSLNSWLTIVEAEYQQAEVLYYTHSTQGKLGTDLWFQSLFDYVFTAPHIYRKSSVRHPLLCITTSPKERSRGMPQLSHMLSQKTNGRRPSFQPVNTRTPSHEHTMQETPSREIAHADHNAQDFPFINKRNSNVLYNPAGLNASRGEKSCSWQITATHQSSHFGPDQTSDSTRVEWEAPQR